MASPLILVPGSAPKPTEPPSTLRRAGKPHGSHMADLWEQRQAIWLCRNCSYKFDYKKHNYYREKYYCVGKCDACYEQNSRNNLFIHESYLVNQGGKSVHGQSWIPS